MNLSEGSLILLSTSHRLHKEHMDNYLVGRDICALRICQPPDQTEEFNWKSISKKCGLVPHIDQFEALDLKHNPHVGNIDPISHPYVLITTYFGIHGYTQVTCSLCFAINDQPVCKV